MLIGPNHTPHSPDPRIPSQTVPQESHSCARSDDQPLVGSRPRNAMQAGKVDKLTSYMSSRALVVARTLLGERLIPRKNTG